MKKWFLRVLLALLLVTAVIVVIAPASRQALIGFCRGEPFYRWRPASYWGQVLFERHNRPQQNATGGFDRVWGFFGISFSEDEPEGPKFDADAVPVFLWLLKHGNADTRGIAAIYLGVHGEGSEESVVALTEALRDPDRGVRSSAASGLGATGGRGLDVVPALLTALQDEDGAVRLSAVRALGEIGAMPQSTRALIDCLQHNDLAVQSAALRSLQKIGPGAEEAVPALLPLLQHEYYYIKYGAAEALLRINLHHEAAIETLKLGLMHKNPEARRWAIQGFRAASPTPDVIRTLNHACWDDDTFVSREAELIIQWFEHKAASAASEHSPGQPP